MTTESAIDDLTLQATTLYGLVTTTVAEYNTNTTNLLASVSQAIADAVDVSVNAALEPMLLVATNLVRSQTLVVTLTQRIP
jgi:hypothetical protein